MTTLKEYTRQKHDKIERAPLSMLIMSGEITKKQWDLLIRQKAFVYEKIEELFEMPEYAKLSHKVHADLDTQYRTLLGNTYKYLKHLENLPKDQIAAHLYVHYMGEYFGGQIMKKKIPYENKTHMDIEQKAEAVAYIRDLITGKDEILRDEANTAFDLMINIHDEIFSVTKTHS